MNQDASPPAPLPRGDAPPLPEQIGPERIALQLNQFLPSAHLTLLSVLQGVGLSVLAVNLHTAPPGDFPNWLLYLDSLLLISVVWFLYVAAFVGFLWPLNSFHTTAQFGFAAAEVYAFTNIHQPRQWLYGVAALFVLGAFIRLLNTAISERGMYVAGRRGRKLYRDDRAEELLTAGLLATVGVGLVVATLLTSDSARGVWILALVIGVVLAVLLVASHITVRSALTDTFNGSRWRLSGWGLALPAESKTRVEAPAGDANVSADAPVRTSHHPELGVGELRRRLLAHGRESYAVLFNVMKSVSIATALVALQRLVTGGDEVLPRLPLLLASLAAVTLTYTGTTVGNNLLPGRFGVLDALMPVLLTLAEAWPLAVLASSAGTDFVIRVWVISMAAFNLVAAGMLTWARTRMQQPLYADEVWSHVVQRYRRALLRDIASATATAAALGGAFAALACGWVHPSPWTQAAVIGGSTALGYVGALMAQERAGVHIRHGLERADAATSAEPSV